MKLKKIISLLSAAIMIIGMAAMPITAADTEDSKITEEMELLKGLNILDALPMAESRYIERGEFVKALSMFFYDEPQDPEATARVLGFISSGEEFESQLYMTIEEAAKYSVISLGYRRFADENGGTDDAYMLQARTLGVMNGITKDKEMVLMRNDAVKMLCNVLRIEPFAQYYTSKKDNGYKILKNETLLSMNRDIEKIKGVVEETFVTGLDNKKGCSKSQVKIGSEMYPVDYKYSKDLLGKYVEAYVQRNKGDDEILFMLPRNSMNEELVIKANDIDGVANDFSYIEYYETDTRKKKAKISLTPSVIYNEKFLSGYTAADLMPEIGEVRLLDNDNDGMYDVIFVTDCDTMVVDSVATNPAVIYDKISIKGKKDSLELDDLSMDYDVYINGAPASLSAVTVNNVANVAKSKDGDYAAIYISSEVKTGNLGGVTMEEDEILIDEEPYIMTPEFEKWYTDEAGDPAQGRQYTFYMDYFGNVAFMEYTPASKYMLYLKSAVESDGETYKVRYMDTAGTWHSDKLAKKVNYNGTRYKASLAYDELQSIAPQVVTLETNAQDEITQIKTAVKYTGENKIDDFTVEEIGGAWEPYVLGFSGRCYINGATRMFIFPENDKSREEDDYSVRSIGMWDYFKEWKGYGLKAYDLDDFRMAKVLSIVDSASIHQYASEAQTFFVTNTDLVYDVDGDFRNAIKGVLYETAGFVMVEAKEGVFDNLKKGDLIHYTQDAYGRVDWVSVAGNIYSDTEMGDDYVKFSKVVATDPANLRIKYTTNGVEYVSYVNQGVSIKFFDTERGKIRIGKLSEVRPGQKILCTMNGYKISNMIVGE